MSKSELLATHNRDHIWPATTGHIKVRDMKTSHIERAIAGLQLRLRKSSCYPSTHPQRRHEASNEYHLRTFIAELEWRTRNGL